MINKIEPFSNPDKSPFNACFNNTQPRNNWMTPDKPCGDTFGFR